MNEVNNNIYDYYNSNIDNQSKYYGNNEIIYNKYQTQPNQNIPDILNNPHNDHIIYIPTMDKIIQEKRQRDGNKKDYTPDNNLNITNNPIHFITNQQLVYYKKMKKRQTKIIYIIIVICIILLLISLALIIYFILSFN